MEWLELIEKRHTTFAWDEDNIPSKELIISKLVEKSHINDKKRVRKEIESKICSKKCGELHYSLILPQDRKLTIDFPPELQFIHVLLGVQSVQGHFKLHPIWKQDIS